MKKGDTVTIFKDPYTCRKSEGEAVLIACIKPEIDFENGFVFDRWIVHFIDDGRGATHRRTVRRRPTDCS